MSEEEESKKIPLAVRESTSPLRASSFYAQKAEGGIISDEDVEARPRQKREKKRARSPSSPSAKSSPSRRRKRGRKDGRRGQRKRKQSSSGSEGSSTPSPKRPKRMASADLKALWDEREVPISVQNLLEKEGFVTIEKFAQLDDTREGVRMCCVQDMGMTGSGLKWRATVGSLVLAWEHACKYVEVRREMEAEARVNRVPPQLIKNDHIVLRRAFEKAHKSKLEDKHVPSRDYIEKSFTDVTEGDLRAESLKEVTSILEEATDDYEKIAFDRTGTLKVKRCAKEGRLPQDSEGMRDKVKLMSVKTSYVQSRFPNKAYLQGMGPHIWDKHIEYVLSDQIHRLAAKDGHGTVVATPPWALVVSYEYQIRKKAFALLASDEMDTLANAMTAARKCTETKEIHFLTPFTVCRMGDTGVASIPNEYSKRNRGNGRSSYGGYSDFGGLSGGGKQKGSKGSARKGFGKGGFSKGGGKKGKSTGLPKDLPDLPRKERTADGQQICYTYNMSGQFCPGCQRVHSCWWCSEKHAGHNCPTYRAAQRKGGITDA